MLDRKRDFDQFYLDDDDDGPFEDKMMVSEFIFIKKFMSLMRSEKLRF